MKQYAYNLQYNNIEPEYWQIVTTCKHFNVHTGPDHNRASFDSIVRYDDWYLTFQPAFRACAAVKVGSFMCSYNEINGIPACGNRELLQEILRFSSVFLLLYIGKYTFKFIIKGMNGDGMDLW